MGWHTLKKILAYPEPPGYRLSQRGRSGSWERFCRSLSRSWKRIGRLRRSSGTRSGGSSSGCGNEHGYSGGLTMVSMAVREWRQSRKEVFLPLSHPPGEAQVDYGEAKIKLNGQETSVALLVMTLPYSERSSCKRFHANARRRFWRVIGGRLSTWEECRSGSATTIWRSR